MSENEQKPVQQPPRLRPTNPPEVMLAAGTQTSGELKAEGDVRVDGTFEGRIEVVGWVIVGEQARVTADITARHVQVNGWVHGAIQAVGQVQVGPTGQVWGDVEAAEVFVDPGGQVHPSDEEIPLQPALPSMPTPEPAATPVEVIPPTRQPAREHLRQAEDRARQQMLRRWGLSLGVIAVGVSIVCGVLVLSGILAGTSPVSEAPPTPTLLAAGPTTPTPVSEATPTSTATPRPTLVPIRTPVSEATPTSTPEPSPTNTATNTPTNTPTQPPTAPAPTATASGSPPATQAPTATIAPASPTPTATEVTAPTASPTSTATEVAAPTASPTSTVEYPFVPDGPVVSEYPNCAPAVIWLRGEVRNATPEQLQYVQVQAQYPDGRTLTEPVQPNGSYEVRLYTQGPCPVTLVDSRDGTRLSPTVYVEYADTCNGSAFTLHWKRTEAD